MNHIKYYLNGKSEVLEISDSDGNIFKNAVYTQGNCLIDVLLDDDQIEVNPHLKTKIICLMNKCKNYLVNDIVRIIEKEFGFIFSKDFCIRYELIENRLCRVLYTDDVEILLCYLILLIYMRKLMYKQCANCNKYFATKYQCAKYCSRIACINGRTCKQVGAKNKCK